MNMLVTGGAGYIGSHTVLELLEHGHAVTVIDNLSNSSAESIKRVESIAKKKVDLHIFDLVDTSKLEALFASKDFDAVIHFAGLKAVGESVSDPLRYYYNNLVSTLCLTQAMERHGPKQLVFSSSATVYGNPAHIPIDENSPIQPTNPYGQTKAMIEQMLKDLAATKQGWQISLLRYFNPVGAHPSGLIGEDPLGIPNNLLPYICRVAVGSLPELSVFGSDYETPDGTGVRDYIHVVDLARGHLAAIDHPAQLNQAAVYNLGTGKGYSVLEVIKAFEQVSGKHIAYKIVARRSGDIAICYADVSKANKELNWHTTKTLSDACADSWHWQSNNPKGYK